MLFLIIFLFAVLSAVGIGALAGWSDFKGMTIPNIYSVFIVLAFIPAFAADHFAGAGIFFFWQSHLIALAVMFVATFIMFALRTLGGGDAKLLSAYALWFGLKGLPIFIFYTAFLGGVLGLAALVLRQWKPIKSPAEGSWIARVQDGESKVPYGIPIAGGALLSFFLLDFVSPENLMQFFTTQTP